MLPLGVQQACIGAVNLLRLVVHVVLAVSTVQVDLYSLGVVVFEMWHPFSTGMERAVLLRELREAGKLPQAWEEAHPQVARLVR